jgi:histone H3/H4
MDNLENDVSKNQEIIENIEDQENLDSVSESNEDVDNQEDEIEEEDESLPFPKATVVRLMRKSLDSHKQIKGIVKIEMNIFIGKIIEIVCKKMNAFDYSYVDYGMFKQAIETYENIHTIELEKIRLIKSLDRIKADCDTLIDDVERKFHE